MDRTAAQVASTWEYHDPYHIYNMDSDEKSMTYLLGGSFYSVYQGEDMIGYFCFGKAARIPWAEENGYYDLGYTDIGLAMRPDLTGKGLGLKFFKLGLNYGEILFPQTTIRLTVACFNHRAQKVYQRAGFKKIGEFSVPGGKEFEIMVQETI